MKKFAIMVLMCMLALMLTACGGSRSEGTWTEEKMVNGENVKIVHMENGITLTFHEAVIVD